MKSLVNGTAGFIGSHLPVSLCEGGGAANGIENLSDHYDVMLKKARLECFAEHPNNNYIHADIADRAAAHEPQWNLVS